MDGDIFLLSGVGGNSARLWAFTDLQGNVLSRATAGEVVSNKFLTAPKNARYFVINFSTDYSYSAKKVFVKDSKETDNNFANLVSNWEKTIGSSLLSIGGIDNTNGLDFSSNKFVRSTQFFPSYARFFSIPSELYKVCLAIYTTDNLNSYDGFTSWSQCGNGIAHSIPSAGTSEYTYRWLIAKVDGTDMTSADLTYLSTYIERYTPSDISTSRLITMNVPMRHARLSSLGNESGAADENWYMYNYAVSVRLLKICNHKNTIALNSVLEQDLDFDLACYDNDYAFLGFYAVNAMPSETVYVKLYVHRAGQASTATSPITVPSINITITYKGETPKLVKNQPLPDTVYPYTRWISYEMKLPEAPVDSDDATYGGNQGFVWNNGYVILPPNYSNEGAPVPLVIFTHGSGGYRFSETDIISYRPFLEFIAKNGYAVCDCSMMTSANGDMYDPNFPCPLTFACYDYLYKYLVDAYNIDDSGCYIFGKSAGGQNAIQLGLMSNIPVKAIGVIAGACDSILNAKVYGGDSEEGRKERDTIILWLQQLGIDTSDVPLPYYTHDNVFWSQIVSENFEKFIGFNPMWLCTSNFDKATFAGTVAGMTCNEANLSSSETLANIIDNAEKISNVPIKWWHALDDVNVPPTLAEMFIKTVRNGGGIGALHMFPAGNGAHWMGDTAENAPRVDYSTKYGGIVNTTVVYAELVDWFNQW